jgi:hypothetical protein
MFFNPESGIRNLWYLTDAFDVLDAPDGFQPVNDFLKVFDIGDIDGDLYDALAGLAIAL